MHLSSRSLYFVTQIVLTYLRKNCSITIYSNSEGQNNLWQQNAFLTCSWRFLRYNKLERLEFKLEKIIGIWKHAGKIGKICFFVFVFSLRKWQCRQLCDLLSLDYFSAKNWEIGLAKKMQQKYIPTWYWIKVLIFWEGHKNFQNLHLTFVCMYCRQK